MKKPDLLYVNKIMMNDVQRYKRYLPTAFDESLSILEKINQLIFNQDKIGELTNEMIDRWNTVIEWVIGEGLSLSVKMYLDKLLENGEFEEIINQKIFGELNDTLNNLKNSNDSIFINVKFPPKPFKGVISDGSDQSKTIQKLMDLALLNNITLYFPDGDYGIGTHLFWRSNTKILLSEKAKLIRLGSINKILQNGEQNNPNYSQRYDGDSNLILKGGIIDLNYSGYPLADSSDITCINIGHAHNVLIEGLTIENGQNGHYFQIASSENVTIRDCVFRDQHSTYDGNIHEIIQIEIMSKIGFPSFGSYDLTPCRNITVENCVFENCIRAVGTHGDAKYETNDVVYCENIKIVNNTIKNMKSIAVGLVGYDGVLFEGNYIEDVGMYGIYTKSSKSLKIRDNEVKNIKWTGLHMVDTILSSVSNNNFINVCNEEGSEYAGIRCLGLEDVSFENNLVHSKNPNYTFAHYFSNDSKIIIRNHRYTEGKNGLIYASDATQLNQLVTGNGRTILFEGDLSDVGQIAELSQDMRLFSMVVIVANNNNGNANMVSMVIPKDMYNWSEASGRFRIITATGGIENTSFQIDFATPTTRKLRVDAIYGNGHIRKVIGIV